jgi:hypothetical protein
LFQEERGAQLQSELLKQRAQGIFIFVFSFSSRTKPAVHRYDEAICQSKPLDQSHKNGHTQVYAMHILFCAN